MNENLSETYAEALEANGVQPELARQAADIIANDDPLKENLGRSEEEQAVIHAAWLAANPTHQ